MPRAIALDIGEAQLAENIRELCAYLGLRVFHCYDARRSWGPGYPDLTIAGRCGLLFRELKTERGKTTADQDHWAVALQEAGQNWALWRPSDWASGQVRRELEKVAGR